MATRPHGDDRRYGAGCRCTPCRNAHAQVAARRRRLIAYGRWRGEIDAAGTRRRLQALAAIGWTFSHIAGRLGIDPSWVRALARGDHGRVHGSTVDRFTAIYQALSGQPGPSDLARRRAAAKGWLPPEAWDDTNIDDPAGRPHWPVDPPLEHPDRIVDIVAIRRALAGERLHLTRLERHHAVHVGRARGMSLYQIADALHRSYTTVRELAEKPLPNQNRQEVAA